MKNRKLLWILCFSLFVITGCKNLFDIKSPSQDQTEYTITGAIVNGINQSEARSAFPSQFSGAVYYNVNVKGKGITGSVNDAGTEYSVTVPSGVSEIVIKGYTDSYKTNQVYEGSVKVNTASLLASYPVVLRDVVTQYGTGTVKLPIYIEDDFNVTRFVAKWGSKERKYSSGIDFTPSPINVAVEFTMTEAGVADLNVTSGTYEVEFLFYAKDAAGSEYLAYVCMQSIQVSDNLETNRWVNNGTDDDDCLLEVGGKLSLDISLQLVTNFLSTYIYVDPDVDSSVVANGTYNKPFKTVQQAIDVARNLNNDYEFKIYIKNEITAENTSEFTDGNLIKIPDASDSPATLKDRPLTVHLRTYPSTNTSPIDANGLGRVLYVGKGNTVYIDNISVSGGKADDGAGIKINQGTVVLADKADVRLNTGYGIFLTANSDSKLKITGNALVLNAIYFDKSGTDHGEITLTSDISAYNKKGESSESVDTRYRLSFEDYTTDIKYVDLGSFSSSNTCFAVYNSYGDVIASDGSYSIDTNGKLQSAGNTIINIFTPPVPVIKAGTAAAGQDICVRVYSSIQVNETRYFKWQENISGVWTDIQCHTTVSSGVTNYFSNVCRITMKTGTTEYRCIVSDGFGTEVIVENSIICDAAYNNIGKIYYSDKTYSSLVESGKTPIGIVGAVDDTDGVTKDSNGCYPPSRLMNLEEKSTTVSWCTSDAAGKSEISGWASFDENDGSLNEAALINCMADATAEDLSKYPPFEYARSLTDGGLSWYVPAKNELVQLAANGKAIDDSLDALGKDKYSYGNICTYIWASNPYSKYWTWAVKKNIAPNPGYVVSSGRQENSDGTDILYGVRTMAKLPAATAYTEKDTVVHSSTPAEAVEWVEGTTGTGSSYFFKTEGELKDFRDYVNAGGATSGKSFYLAGNIELTGDWTPIGTAGTKCFSGVFDGCNYTISGLSLNETNSAQGFFGYCKNSTIKNLTIKGAVTCSNYHTGGLIAIAQESNTIDNCIVNVTVSGNERAGGIVGYKSGTGTLAVTNCVNFGDVSGNKYVAGILGYAYATGVVIKNCANFGKITGTNYVAGIATSLYAITIENCHNAYANNSCSGICAEDSAGVASFNNCFYLSTTLGLPDAKGKSSNGDSSLTNVSYYTHADGASDCVLANEKQSTTDLRTALNAYGGIGETYYAWVYSDSAEYKGFPVFEDTVARLKESVGAAGGGTLAAEASFSVHNYTPPAGAVTLSSLSEAPSSGVYLISSTADLVKLRTFAITSTFEGVTLVVTQEVAFPSEWYAIGSSSFPFAGTIEGNGYELTGLGAPGSVTSSSNSTNGFIYYANGVTIRNLTISGSWENASYAKYCSGFVCWAKGNVLIENCINNYSASILSSITASNTACNTGGFIGYADGSTSSVIIVRNCVNKADLSNFQAVGGIVGNVSNTAMNVYLENCINYGAIYTKGQYAGGIAGSVGNSALFHMNNCVNIGEVTSSTALKGALYGKGNSTNIIDISYDYYLGSSCTLGYTCSTSKSGNGYFFSTNGSACTFDDSVNVNYRSIHYTDVVSVLNAWVADSEKGVVSDTSAVFLQWGINASGYPDLY